MFINKLDEFINSEKNSIKFARPLGEIYTFSPLGIVFENISEKIKNKKL